MSRGQVNELLSRSFIVAYIRQPVGDYRITFISENVKDLYGHEAGEIIEDPELWMRCVHPENVELVQGAMRDLAVKGSSIIEYRLLHREGTYRWVRDQMILSRHTKGAPLDIFGLLVDITECKEDQETLQTAHGDLMRRFERRTEQLENMARHLKEVTSALKVLSRQREVDRQELERVILSNIKELVEPCIGKLKRSGLTSYQSRLLSTLETRLNEIASPFIKSLSDQHSGLTPMEVRVAELIREGKTTKQVAELLHVSENAILFHRHNLRTKLGLKSKKINLISFLQSIER